MAGLRQVPAMGSSSDLIGGRPGVENTAGAPVGWYKGKTSGGNSYFLGVCVCVCACFACILYKHNEWI